MKYLRYLKVLEKLIGVLVISMLIGCGSEGLPDEGVEGENNGLVISEWTTGEETACDEFLDQCGGETTDEGKEEDITDDVNDQDYDDGGSEEPDNQYPSDESPNSDSENEGDNADNDGPDDQYSYEPDDSSDGNSNNSDDNDSDDNDSDDNVDDNGDDENNGDEGGYEITLPVLDSFGGDRLNTDLWVLGRDDVVVEDGYLKIAPCPGCGGGAYVYSVDYESLNSTVIKIEKRTMVTGSRETSFTIQFTDNSRITIFYKRGGSQNSLPSNSFSMTTWPRFETGTIYRRLATGVWGEWFEESIEYDGDTGVIKYDFNNDNSYEVIVNWVPGLAFKSVTGSAWNGTLDNVQKWDWIIIWGE